MPLTARPLALTVALPPTIEPLTCLW